MRTIHLAIGGALLAIMLSACGDVEATASAVPVVPAAPVAGAPAAASVEWLTDFAEAKRQAAARKVPILADFTGSDWCPPCQLLKAEVFDTPAFNAWARGAVVLLTLDFPQDKPQSEALKQQNKELFEHYRLDSYPTVLILDAAGGKRGELSYQPGGPLPWIARAQAIIAK